MASRLCGWFYRQRQSIYKHLSAVHWPAVDEPFPDGVCLDDYSSVNRPAIFEEDEDESESETKGFDNEDDELDRDDGDPRTRENCQAFVQ
jgi:hypothetical protein